MYKCDTYGNRLGAYLAVRQCMLHARQASLQHRHPGFGPRDAYFELAFKSPWPAKRWVQRIGPIGGRDNNQAPSPAGCRFIYMQEDSKVT